MLTLLTSRIGAWLAGAVAIAAAIGAAALALIGVGRRQEEAEADATLVKNSLEANHVENEVARLPAPARRDELREWAGDK